MSERTPNIGSGIYFKYSIVGYQICKEPDFLTGVFEYWSAILEPRGIASRFPYMFENFYSGDIAHSDLHKLQSELQTMAIVLKIIPVKYEDIMLYPLFRSALEKEPSQQKCFAKEATNAHDIFKTYLGDILFTSLQFYVDNAIKSNSSLKIEYSPF